MLQLFIRIFVAVFSLQLIWCLYSLDVVHSKSDQVEHSTLFLVGFAKQYAASCTEIWSTYRK